MTYKGGEHFRSEQTGASRWGLRVQGGQIIPPTESGERFGPFFEQYEWSFRAPTNLNAYARLWDTHAHVVLLSFRWTLSPLPPSRIPGGLGGLFRSSFGDPTGCSCSTGRGEPGHTRVCHETPPGWKVMPSAVCQLLAVQALCRPLGLLGAAAGAAGPIPSPNEAIQEPMCSSRHVEHCRGGS
jgi:hypothetical protein